MRMTGSGGWLNGTVLGIALASLFSDWSHEIATAVMPAFLATMGVAAAWIGIIEGVSDGLSSLAKLASGHWTDRLARRKPIVVAGYLVTTLGTASFGFATAAWHVLASRSAAWLGRGVRSPVKKAMLAAAVTPETYGRAFGFERMMDTIGAVVGPATALMLLGCFGNNFSKVFFWTLAPGLIAVFCIVFLVREKSRTRVKAVTFREGLHSLPPRFKSFLVAVGIFGAGDFAHTLLILFAAQKLAPVYGTTRAAALAVGLYMAHNVFYAGFSYFAGWLADRADKFRLLAAGYALAAAMAVMIVVLPAGLTMLSLVFVSGGIYVACEETLEDSITAQIVPQEHHGMAFGVLAAVNGVGDFASSIVVGILWSVFGTAVAFGYSAALFAVGACLVLRTRRDGGACTPRSDALA
jgi:MFS family permease